MSTIAPSPTASPSDQETRERNLEALSSHSIDYDAIEEYLEVTPESIARLAATICATQAQSSVPQAIRLMGEARGAVMGHRVSLVEKMNMPTLHALAIQLGIKDLRDRLARGTPFDGIDARQKPVLVRLKTLTDVRLHGGSLVELILRAEADSGMTAPRKSFSIIAASRFALANQNLSQELLEFALIEFSHDQRLGLPIWFQDTNVIQRLCDQSDRSLFQEDGCEDFRVIAGLILCFKPYWEDNRSELAARHKKAVAVQAKKSKQKQLAGRKGNSSRAMRTWTSRATALVRFTQGHAFEQVDNHLDEMKSWLWEFANDLVENGKQLKHSQTKAKVVAFFSTLKLQAILPSDDIVAALAQEGIKGMSPEVIETCRGILAGSIRIEA